MAGFWTPEISGGLAAVLGGMVVYIIKEIGPVIKVKFGGSCNGSGGWPDQDYKESISALREDVKEIFHRLGSIEKSVAHIEGRLESK